MDVCAIGEVLWDIFDREERLGGAALNFCANLQRLGTAATLLSAVGQDTRGTAALAHMASLGLNTSYVQRVADLPTGTAIVGTAPNGEPQFTIPRPAAFDRVHHSAELERKLADGPNWLYFGTLLQTVPTVEAFTTRLVESSPQLRCFYDMNLRTGHWSLPVVQRLSSLASILKLNESEAETLHQQTSGSVAQGFSLEAFCQRWATTYSIDIICVTLGSAGCLIYEGGRSLRVPGFRVEVCDTVGSGDAFAAAFLHGLQQGWSVVRSAQFANALGALVASRPGATPPWALQDCLALMRAQPEAAGAHPAHPSTSAPVDSGSRNP